MSLTIHDIPKPEELFVVVPAPASLDTARKQIRQAATNIVADFNTIDTMSPTSLSSFVTVTTNLYDRISRNLETINSLTPLAFKQ